MPATVYHYKNDTVADFTGVITLINSSGGTQTAQASDLVRPSDWNSSHSASIAVLGNEIFTANFYEPFILPNTNSSQSSLGAGTWYLDPFFIPSGIGSGQLNFMLNDAAGFLNGGVLTTSLTGSVTRYQTLNTQLAIYQPGTGANTTRIERIWSVELSQMFTWERRISSTTAGGGTTSGNVASNYLTASFPSQWDASGGVTYGTASASGTFSTSVSTAASTRIDSLITGAVAYASGNRIIPFPFATTLGAGEYYMGMMVSSTSSSTGTNYSTGTMANVQSILHLLEFPDAAYKRLGQSTSNSSTCMLPFHGFVATTSGAPFSTLGTSDMRNFAAPGRRYFNYLQSTY